MASQFHNNGVKRIARWLSGSGIPGVYAEAKAGGGGTSHVIAQGVTVRTTSRIHDLGERDRSPFPSIRQQTADSTRLTGKPTIWAVIAPRGHDIDETLVVMSLADAAPFFAFHASRVANTKE